MNSTNFTTPTALIVEWSLGKFFTNEQISEEILAKVLAGYLRSCIDCRGVGIIYDRYFHLISTNGEKEKQTIDGISKLHLTHINELVSEMCKITH
jgi:hypothetical protein